MGCTGTFEWLGKQAVVKVQEVAPRLVLLQVRDKRTGRYWHWQERAALAERHLVPVVQQVPELQGKRLAEVSGEVKKWIGKEGVVVRLESGRMFKVKSNWWLDTRPHKWGCGGRGELEVEALGRRRAAMHTRQQRAVLVGWPKEQCLRVHSETGARVD